MSDNEIMKALGCHKSKSLLDCKKCPLYAKKMCFEQCYIELFESLYDLINRQKAEIEELKKYKHDYYVLKSEARKEFAERLKQKYKYHVLCGYEVINGEIDDLLKEMESESNGI